MSEATPAPEAPAKPKIPAPSNLKDLREQVKVMVGQKIHEVLQDANPSAAQLHVAMKWLDQTASGNAGPTKTPWEIALEENAKRLASASKSPDLAPGPDEVG